MSTGRIHEWSDAEGKTITQVYYSSYAGGPTNAEYDARLIAAAPQLLEALEEAVASGMVPVSSAADGGAVAYSRVVRAADQIRAAIKAAKGAA